MAPRFEKVTREESLRLTTRWQKDGDSWHFHMLPPSCHFNDDSEGRDVILLENSSQSFTLVVTSSGADFELGKKLAQTVHAEVFQAQRNDCPRPAAWFSTWNDQIQEWLATGTTWHHHMLFPDCVLNDYSPKWVLMLESPNMQPFLHTDEVEPVAEFVAIERFVWQRKD